MNKYLQMLRVKHYIKNFLIFLPAFFGEKIFFHSLQIVHLLGFLAFSLCSSGIYIMNDLKDIQKDREHPEKKARPIASGVISKRMAICWLIVLMIVSFGLQIFISYGSGKKGMIWLAIYLLINILYSFGLKDVPIVDVIILAFGFVIRVLYGAAIDGIDVSGWLYLTIWSASLYMGLGKRRNESIQQKAGKIRPVLKFYSSQYLENMMHLFLALTVVFYSLWCANVTNYDRVPAAMIWTLPIVLMIVMRYEMLIDVKDSSGNPVEVLLADKALFLLGSGYILFTLSVIYVL